MYYLFPDHVFKQKMIWTEKAGLILPAKDTESDHEENNCFSQSLSGLLILSCFPYGNHSSLKYCWQIVIIKLFCIVCFASWMHRDEYEDLLLRQRIYVIFLPCNWYTNSQSRDMVSKTSHICFLVSIFFPSSLINWNEWNILWGYGWPEILHLSCYTTNKSAQLGQMNGHTSFLKQWWAYV